MVAAILFASTLLALFVLVSNPGSGGMGVARRRKLAGTGLLCLPFIVRRSDTGLRPSVYHTEVKGPITERRGGTDIRHPVATSLAL